MKIQYASDIHLELSDNLRFIKVSHLRLQVMCWFLQVIPVIYGIEHSLI